MIARCWRRLHVVRLRHSHDFGLKLFAALVRARVHRFSALCDVAGLPAIASGCSFFSLMATSSHFHEVGREVGLLSRLSGPCLQHQLPRLAEREDARPARPHHLIRDGARGMDDSVLRPVGPLARSASQVIANCLSVARSALDFLFLSAIQAVSGYFCPPRLPVLPVTKVAPSRSRTPP